MDNELRLLVNQLKAFIAAVNDADGAEAVSLREVDQTLIRVGEICGTNEAAQPVRQSLSEWVDLRTSEAADEVLIVALERIVEQVEVLITAQEQWDSEQDYVIGRARVQPAPAAARPSRGLFDTGMQVTYGQLGTLPERALLNRRRMKKLAKSTQRTDS